MGFARSRFSLKISIVLKTPYKTLSLRSPNPKQLKREIWISHSNATINPLTSFMSERNINNPLYALGLLPSTVGSRFLNFKLYHEISNLTQNIYIERNNRSLEDYVVLSLYNYMIL